MKKLLLMLLLALIAMPLASDANMLLRRRVEMGGSTGASSTGTSSTATTSVPDCEHTCCEEFTTGDTSDVAGNTIFDSETDANSKLSISSNKLAYSAGVSAQNGYVDIASSCDSISAETEMTAHFKVTFDDITDIDGAAGSCTVLRFFNGSDHVLSFTFKTDANGDLVTYTCSLIRQNSGGACAEDIEYTSDRSMTGVAADTEYDAYVYWSADASTGGVECKVGSWTAVNTGMNDDTSTCTVDNVRFGGVSNSWGDGTTDTNIRFDSFYIDKSDTR